MKQIINKIIQATDETVEGVVHEGATIVSGVISGKDLVGDVKPLDEKEEVKIKAEDEKKKQEGLLKLRNVEEEIKEVRDEKKKEEDEKEKEFLENLKRQREAEEAERQQYREEPGNASREAKKKQFVPGPKKKAPDPSQMSQTSEFKGKID